MSQPSVLFKVTTIDNQTGFRKILLFVYYLFFKCLLFEKIINFTFWSLNIPAKSSVLDFVGLEPCDVIMQVYNRDILVAFGICLLALVMDNLSCSGTYTKVSKITDATPKSLVGWMQDRISKLIKTVVSYRKNFFLLIFFFEIVVKIQNEKDS